MVIINLIFSEQQNFLVFAIEFTSNNIITKVLEFDNNLKKYAIGV